MENGYEGLIVDADGVILEGEDDFGFYGVDEDGVVEEIKGITDNISSYTFTDMSYPCMVIGDGFSCPKHKMIVISNMVKMNSSDKDINLYFVKDGELYKMGMLAGSQVMAFVDLVGEKYLTGYFEEGIELSGDMIYVLAS